MGDMNAPLRVRIREGCRGGREQFKWNQIKDQDFKDREQYLGSSTKVGLMGKFGRYYVHDWFARSRDQPENIKEELQSVQAYEEELMQEALGLKPKKLMLSKKQLNEEELKEFLKRDDDKREDQKGRAQMGPQKKIMTNEYGEQIATSNEDYVAVAAREAPIKGLGFAMHRTSKLEEIKAQTFGTEGTLQGSSSSSSSLLKSEVKTEVKDEIKTEMKREDDDDTASIVDGVVPLLRGASVKREASPSALGREDRKERKRERSPEARTKSEKKDKKRKKEEKKLKKAEKKLKKAAKKEKKSARKARKALGEKVSSSSSSSS